MTRAVTTFFVWCAIGIAAGVLALVTAPRLAGITPFTILSGSMTPTLGVGDVVLDEKIAPLTARPGDIVTFPDQSRGGAMVTHRVRSIEQRGASVTFVTQGDANTVSERWSVAANGSIGRVRMHVPKVGYVLQWTGTREGRFGLIAVPAFILLFLELNGMLRPGRRRGEAVA
jgi:signal peptidase